MKKAKFVSQYGKERKVAIKELKSLRERGLSEAITYSRQIPYEAMTNLQIEESDFTEYFLLGCNSEEIQLLNQICLQAEVQEDGQRCVHLVFSKVNEDGDTVRFEGKDYEKAPDRLGPWKAHIECYTGFDTYMDVAEDLLVVVFTEFPN